MIQISHCSGCVSTLNFHTISHAAAMMFICVGAGISMLCNCIMNGNMFQTNYSTCEAWFSAYAKCYNTNYPRHVIPMYPSRPSSSPIAIKRCQNLTNTWHQVDEIQWTSFTCPNSLSVDVHISIHRRHRFSGRKNISCARNMDFGACHLRNGEHHCCIASAKFMSVSPRSFIGFIRWWEVLLPNIYHMGYTGSSPNPKPYATYLSLDYI